MQDFQDRYQRIPLASLSMEEVREIVNLWEKERVPVQVNSAIANTAELAEVLEISEYEVGALLSRVRKQQPAAPIDQPAENGRRTPALWILVPAFAIGVLLLINVMSSSNEESVKPVGAERPTQNLQPALASMGQTITTPSSSQIGRSAPQDFHSPISVAPIPHLPVGLAIYLSPDEVERKANVFVQKLLTE